MTTLYIRESRVLPVELGNVKQIICPERKRRRSVKLGDKLSLYVDSYTASRRRLRSTKCDDVLPIFIDCKSVILGSRVLTDAEKHRLALGDGFNNFTELLSYFNGTDGLPMKGQLVKWL